MRERVARDSTQTKLQVKKASAGAVRAISLLAVVYALDVQTRTDEEDKVSGWLLLKTPQTAACVSAACAAAARAACSDA